jgi:hypothetical protein
VKLNAIVHREEQAPLVAAPTPNVNHDFVTNDATRRDEALKSPAAFLSMAAGST